MELQNAGPRPGEHGFDVDRLSRNARGAGQKLRSDPKWSCNERTRNPS